jgi:hypothetical protein
MALGIGLLALDVFIVWFLLNGAPYVPSKMAAVKRMARCANAGPGTRCADIGSGDGRIVIEMARVGAEAHGYESNPLLVWWSRRQIARAGLADRAFIHRENFWHSDFSSFNAVTLFGITHIMKRLGRKLQQELKPGALIVSNAFEFPGLQCVTQDDGIYVYQT